MVTNSRSIKAKIRGEVSEGMICAPDELGLSPNHEGIMVLTTSLPNGTPAKEYFNFEDDVVMEIGLTPNRSDATSHIGVARDIKALLDRPVNLPDISDFKIDNNDNPVEIIVENEDACPRYSGITISGVAIKDSPDWLKQKLLAIGQLPINNVVDVTNFVLHELGQPLHAFDADKIKGSKVIVKTLPAGSLFTTLDEKKRTLYDNDLMICDAQEGMCIAGVFGGLHSGVTEGSKNIFLESAYFSPDYIRKTAQQHDLKTDAAFRFERGTDPNNTVFALKRATMLIKTLAGGNISSEIIDVYPRKIENQHVNVSLKRVRKLIGKAIPEPTIFKILKLLDIDIQDIGEDTFIASVPPYRADVTREADIAEEILRIYGYENVEIPENVSSEYLAEFPSTDRDQEQYKIAQTLSANGYYEIITNSLTKTFYTEKSGAFNPENDVNILNKLSEDLGVMRQSLLFTGLEVIAYNINHRQKDLKLYEFGKTYRWQDNRYVERFGLGVWATGNYEKENWNNENRKLKFHDFYAEILKIINKFKTDDHQIEIFGDALFQSGLRIFNARTVIARLGQLNKKITKLTGVSQEVFFAEIDFDWLLSNIQKEFIVKEISKFPEVRRDLSLVIDKKITFEQIRTITQEKEFKGILKNVNVFDYYVGENIEKDKKAYALSFILQDEHKTLTDRAIEKTMKRLMELFESKLGAVIRK